MVALADWLGILVSGLRRSYRHGRDAMLFPISMHSYELKLGTRACSHRHHALVDAAFSSSGNFSHPEAHPEGGDTCEP